MVTEYFNNYETECSKLETEEDLVKLYYLADAYGWQCDFFKSSSGDLYTNLLYHETGETNSLLSILKNFKCEKHKLDNFVRLNDGELGLNKANDYSPIILDEGEELPKKLYHYTNGQGLIGILGGKKLWATQHSFLNDKVEMHYAIGLFRKCVDKEVKKFDKESETYRKLSNLNWIVGDFINLNHVFVTSFSENGDLLSQWRGYGTNGFGYSLGFNPRMISLTAEKKQKDFILLKVIYERLLQEEIIKEYLEKYAALLVKHAKDLENASDEFLELENGIIFNLVRFKHTAFREEAEWRIISFSGANYFNDSFKDLKVRSGSNSSINNLIIYKEIDFMPDLQGLFSKSPIKEIIIGPQNDFDKSKMALEILLNKSFGENLIVDILKSDASSYHS